MRKLLSNIRLDPDVFPALLLPLAGIAAAVALLPIGNFTAEVATGDLGNYFIPWMDAVQAGGLASLSSEFADYTPPYIYLMYFASWLVPLVGPVAAIKLINLPFIALLSFTIHQIVFRASGSYSRAATAGAVVCVAPTLLVNAFAWGQADSIYTSFLALFVLFAIMRAPVAAASMFGVAVAFKLQAMFLSPVLLYLILARQIRIRHLILIPVVYLVMMVPAAIAGRPWFELVTIYGGQADFFSELAMQAPNPWRIVGALDLVDYRTGLFIGFSAAGLASIAIAVSSLRLEPTARTIVLVAALSGAVMPYLLPKMHDRYFFVADIMALTLAFVVPRLWLPAPLFQIGSLLAYLPYFGLSGRGAVFAIVPVTFGVMILTWEYVRTQIGSRVSLRDVLIRNDRWATHRTFDARNSAPSSHVRLPS